MSAAFYSFHLGDFKCTVLRDGILFQGRERILKRYVGGTEAAYEQAFTDLGLNIDEAETSYNVLVVDTGSERVMVDAGQRRLLVESLALAGMTPEQITLIVLTHTHVDHVYGLLTDEAAPVFPNARFVISDMELAFWQARIDGGQVDDGAILAMMRAQGLTVIHMDAEILPGLRAIPIPGHTPGQIGLEITSGGETLIHLADVLHSPIQFAHPEWSPSFDADMNQSVPTRKAALGRVASDGARALFYHMAFPGVGRVQELNGGYVWERAT